MEELLRQYGYWMVIAGTLVQGDATAITAAFLAHRGIFSLTWVCTLLVLTTALENVVLYEIARTRGDAWAIGTDRMSRRIQTVLGWVRTRGIVLVVGSRFLLGLRAAAALACGIAHMPRAKYYWANLMGAVVWTTVMVIAGYSGGYVFSALAADFRRHELLVAMVLAAVVTIAVLWKTRGAEIVDLYGTTVMIERWAESGLSKRRKRMFRSSSK
ncbi:MAG: VTT domain-containing protein [Acidobacteriota bacterium]